ncbi:tRNA threonylcarbamoyladenosine biosynthesis protein TsaB [hydrothermal vent metagenome]|uniref:tRNA threonylcarbamoyladenosine biosynthesis protein TsaB n=1 Tax=hydrothermal vent metagenome TaxID=652676 RepID=A0A3B0WVE8_9ZZZZ
MKILAIDTATEACSAALYIDDELPSENITSRYRLAPREHSRLILKMIDDLLAEVKLSISSIDAIAFGQGPGSFMGLRIAAGVVQGIAFAHDIPVIPISTLKAIAQRAYEKTGDTNVLATIDARMDEVYWAAYSLKGERWQLHDEEHVISPDKISVPVLEDGATWLAAGNGWVNYKDRLLTSANCQLPTILPDCFPSAEAIAKLAVAELNAGNTVSAAEAIPVYLRNNVAKKPKPVRL